MNDLEGGLKMGSRGAFLDKGFSVQNWKFAGYTSDGIKILVPKNVDDSWGMPERSNTPGTSYIMYDKDGVFSNYRIFNDKREPVFEIDYHYEKGKWDLHVHKWKDGNRVIGWKRKLAAYEMKKYQHLLKGVKV